MLHQGKSLEYFLSPIQVLQHIEIIGELQCNAHLIQYNDELFFIHGAEKKREALLKLIDSLERADPGKKHIRTRRGELFFHGLKFESTIDTEDLHRVEAGAHMGVPRLAQKENV